MTLDQHIAAHFHEMAREIKEWKRTGLLADDARLRDQADLIRAYFGLPAYHEALRLAEEQVHRTALTMLLEPVVTDAMVEAARLAPTPLVHHDSTAERERMVLRAQLEAALRAR